MQKHTKNNSNKQLTPLTGTLLITALLAIGVSLSYQVKNNSTESKLIIDMRENLCYDDCNEVKTLAYLDFKLELAQKNREQEKIKREALAAEVAKREAARIEAERIAKAEEEKAKIEAERVKRLEAEKVAHQEKKKEQQVVSRGSDYKGQWRTYEATYYVASCYKCSGIGASGVDLRSSIYHQGMRVIAVDPSVIPLWSIVEIDAGNGVFTAIALDTGGKIKSTKIDVLVGSESEAVSNGIHNVNLRMIRRGK